MRFISRVVARAFVLAALAALTGCATHYLDGAVKDVAAAEFRKPAEAHPVQLVFEFQTNGATNARATTEVKPMVTDAIKTSGLFTAVDDKPVAGGAVLNVQINNVALLDDAFRKGFMTGLTFGIAGSTVTDGYVCTVNYAGPGQAGPIVKTAKHAIYTSMGSGDAPPAAVKAPTIADAVRMMVRQIVDNAMRDVSRDPAFR